tara:strand:+ start:44 stop:496 length:453 start_codon:yes stop_codon:yes gene_type:complete
MSIRRRLPLFVAGISYKVQEISTVDDYLNWYYKDTIIITDSEIDKSYGTYNYKQRGIYFLLHKDIVVYVGLTTHSVTGRVHKHQRNKKFDLVKYIPITEKQFFSDNEYKEQLMLGEYVFINIFNPFYNKQSKNFEYDYEFQAHQNELKKI